MALKVDYFVVFCEGVCVLYLMSSGWLGELVLTTDPDGHRLIVKLLWYSHNTFLPMHV